MQAKLTANVNTSMITICSRSGCPSISRIWASRLVRFVGVAIGLSALASCNSTTTKQAFIDYQQDTGAFTVTTDPAALWNDVKTSFQPRFMLSADDALAKIVPDAGVDCGDPASGREQQCGSDCLPGNEHQHRQVTSAEEPA